MRIQVVIKNEASAVRIVPSGRDVRVPGCQAQDVQVRDVKAVF